MQLSKATYLIVAQAIELILKQTNRNIYFNTLIRTQLSNYCSQQSLKYSKQIQNQQQRQPQFRQNWLIEGQPRALIQDNFFPTAASIQDQPRQVSPKKVSQQKKQRKMTRNNTQVSISQLSQPKKGFKAQQPSPYEKLDLQQPQQQQGILKELRKQVFEQQNKVNQKQKKQQKPKKKEGKQSKQQKLGFDYNGQVIKIRSENRNSLISGGLNGQTLQTVQKLKQVKKNNQTTQIQYERKDRRVPKPVRNNEIQFTQIKTLLSEARATKGIKFIEEGRVIEQKKKIIPAKQLMKTLSGRRLSKDDYNRIKQTNGNIAHFDDYNASKTTNSIVAQPKNEKEDSLSQMRSASESKLSNSILTRRKSTITVSDAQLLQNLIAGAENQAVYKISNSNVKNQQQKQPKPNAKFDSNDYYNLQYMKKGGSTQNIKKSKSTVDLVDVRLPKIETSRQQMPRVRERLKDKEEIVRAIRKKFQQKLRT